MDSSGSVRPRAFPAAVAPLSVVAGVAAMVLAGAAARPLGLRPALLVSELALAAPVFLALSRPGARDAIGARGIDLRRALVSLGAGMALWVASLGLLELQYAVRPPPRGYLEQFQGLHDALRPHSALQAVLSLAAVALAPGLCEELLFRGLALGALLPALGRGGALAVSSLLFGVIHFDLTEAGTTFYRVPFAIAVGVGLGLLRLGSGSTLCCIAAHSVLNAMTFAAALQGPAGAELPTPRPAMGAGLLLAGVAVLLWLLRLLQSWSRERTRVLG